MSKKTIRRIPVSFPILITLLILSLIFFIMFLIIFIDNLDSRMPNLLFPLLFFSFAGIVVFGLFIWLKRKEKPDPAKGNLKRKPIWDVTFDSRIPEPPLLTYSLIGILVLIFILEVVLAFDWTPSIFLNPGLSSLVAFGASSHELVLGGGWYRLFTAVLLHVNLEHLFFNALALFIAGKILEHLIGRVWFLAAFLISGLGGTLFSMWVNPASLVSLGASGAIMGLMGTGYVISFKLKKGQDRKRLQVYLLQVLVLNVIPFLGAAMGSKVDYGAHLGGALAGIALGLFLFFQWGEKAHKSQWDALGKGLAYGCMGLYLLAVGFAVTNYSHLRQLSGMMIPQAQLPAKYQDWLEHSADLTVRYPQDPRGHFFLGCRFLNKQDLPGAEKEFRTALEDFQKFHTYLNRKLEWGIRVELAVLLAEENRLPEAKEIAKPVCLEGITDAKVAESLKKYKLCD